MEKNISKSKKRSSPAKRAGEMLECYKLLAKNSRDIILFVRLLDGKIIEANEAAERAYGRGRDELLSLTIYQLRAPETNRLTEKQMTHADSTGLLFETLHCRSDGTTFPVEVNSQGITIGGERILLSVVRDITERKRIEEALKNRERIYDTLLHNLPGFVYRCRNDQNLTMQFISDGCFSITGYYPEDLIDNSKLTYNDLILPEYQEPLRHKRQEALSTRGYFEEEYLIRAAGGYIKWVWERGYEVFDDSGQPLFLEGYIEDITERKRAEEALRKSEERFRLTTEAAEVGIWDWNLVTNELKWDEMSNRLLGLDSSAAQSYENFVNRIHEDDRGNVGEKICTAIKQKQDYIAEYRIVDSDGIIRWLYARGKGLYDQQGCAVRMSGVAIDITARKRAEELRAASERRYRSLFETASDAIFVVDRQSLKFFDANQAACELYGYTHNDFLQMSVSDISAQPEQSSQSVRQGECRVPLRLHKKKDGTVFPIETTASCFEQDGLQFHVAFVHDITERKRAELLVKETAEKYSTLFNNTSDGVWISNLKGEILEVNDAYCNMSGYSNEELRGMSVSKLEAIDTAEEIAEHRGKIIKNGHDRFETLHRRKDGSIFNVDVTALYFENNGGKIAVFARDITERKQAEELLKNSEVRLRELFEHMSSAVAVYEPVNGGDDFIFKDCNQTLLRIEKVSREHIIGRKITETFPGVKEFGILEVFGRVSKTGNAEHFPVGLYKDHRVYGWRENYIYKLPTGEIVAIYDDVTARKLAEEELLKQKNRLETASLAGRVALWEWYLPSNILEWSSIIDQMLGYEPGTFPRTLRAWGEIIHPEDTPRVMDALNGHLEQGLHYDIEYRVRKKDGCYIWWRDSGVCQRDEQGKPYKMSGACIDISERKLAEKEAIEYQKQLAHASRLSTVGEMASRLTHELNQPFCAILARSEASLRQLKTASPDDAFVKEFDAIANQAERAGKIINRMKRFLRKDLVKFTTIDINAIIEDVALFVEAEARRIHAKVNLALAPSSPPALGDAIQIEQVVLNLVKNGLDAMEETDRKPRMLTISTVVLSDNNMIEVAVCDSGKGIAPENFETIFQSFFTTKPYGLGVGLSISKSIIESHGGKIGVVPNDGRGVTFKFTLPVSDKAET